MLNRTALSLMLAAVALGSDCSRVGDRLSRKNDPQAVTEFTVLYGANCAGCHGADGKGGAARALADPVFLRIVSDPTIRRVVAAGVTGTAMPPFAKQSGGSLTDNQIDAIVGGIRGWTPPDDDIDVDPPAYLAATPGNPVRGGNVYATFCSRCHGRDGRGGPQASSIVDPAFLSLVSDQALRTALIAGRPDIGAPDWRGNVPGSPMSSQDVADIVAWLSAQRPQP